MEFKEHFVDAQIADLVKEYDLISAININAARVCSEIIDGLKPVQRRTLYIMYTKDGGRKFRKIASISGDVFGKAHPHCLHGDTEFILSNGTKKSLKELYTDEDQNFEVLTYDNRNKNICRGTMHSVRITKYVNEYHEIHLSTGGSIKCTNDHCILTMRPSKYEKTRYHEDVFVPTWVRADEIKPGDIIYGGEITNLSFEGNDVGYPSMYVPMCNKYLQNGGGRSFIIHKEFTIDPRLINPDRNKWTIHHKNFNKNDFSKSNLVVMDNSEHNKLHMSIDKEHIQTAYEALDNARAVLVENGYQDQLISRNKAVSKELNRYMPLFKAFKILNKIKNCGESLTELNYDEFRKDTYNSSSLESLYNSKLIMKPTIESLVEEFNSYHKNKFIPYISSKEKKIPDKLQQYIGSLKSVFRKVYSRVVTSGLSIEKENFISGIHKSSHGNIWEECEDAGIDVEAMIDELNYSFIRVTSVSVNKCDSSIPMFDYTVDDYGCGGIYVGSRNENSHSFTIVKNSPTAIDDAVINMSQSWRNTLPLIEPLGNNGSICGDEAGASRYVQARLSEYAIACFFEDWKDSVVDMDLSYDEETKLPEYLPAKYPNVLLNGTLGIGHGLAVNIPSYNFREVVEATIMLMNHPEANIVLIPDTPTGADIIENDFGAICNRGIGAFTERCTYEIDPEQNIITITSLPDLTKAIDIRSKIAEIKEKGGFSELQNMNDLSGRTIKIQLCIRNDVNPYKFMRKLIEQVPGLERTYPINITVTQNYNNYDYSIKQTLLEWIKWRRDQKRVTLINKRSGLLGEQRIIQIKIFITNEKNLQDTIRIFRSGKNRAEIEQQLLDKYKNSEIHIDSLQARTLSNMRMVELSLEAQEEYKAREKELEVELSSLEESLSDPKGVDKLIIDELRDGIKRFGTPRKSNIVPKKISVSNEVEGACILQLSSDGVILRKQGTNVEEEPIPTDSNGFACLVDNDSSFILIDDTGNHSFIKVKELPVDTEVPVARYSKKPLNGNIVALLPADIESDKVCVLVSRKGVVKRIRISDIGPSKKPCISLDNGDRLLRGIVMKPKSNKEILIYTQNGYGQRVDPESIRITLPTAKGGNGFKLSKDDEIIGCYQIAPEQNQYLLYITTKGKMRLNNIQYLPIRNSKYDAMVQLISIGNRDHLFAVVGCNKLDKITVFYDDGSNEVVDISKLQESTMAAEPKKVTQKNAVTSNITKVKLV